jgi:hypothetical protein
VLVRIVIERTGSPLTRLRVQVRLVAFCGQHQMIIDPAKHNTTRSQRDKSDEPAGKPPVNGVPRKRRGSDVLGITGRAIDLTRRRQGLRSDNNSLL